MRQIPEEMAARIESGAATLCHVWQLTRADGTVQGFTDHDRDLVMAGVSCRAASGWTAGAAESGAGSGAGSLAVAGGLDDEGLAEADIAAGLYDGAEVALWRVDWDKPELRVQLWRGTLSRIRREGGAFVAELEGPLAVLERVVGRTYGRMCDASLGDARCGLVPEAGQVCDRRWSTCVGTFGNAVNFRGFPDVPGDDFLTLWPGSAGGVGGANTGGSRR